MAVSSMENISKKKIKKHKKANFFSIKSCFGLSENNIQYDFEDDYIDTGGGKKSAINRNKRSSNRAKTVPVSDSTLIMKACAVAPSKEIHVVEAEEKSSDHHQVNDQETKIKVLEKSKSSFELNSTNSTNTPQETQSKRRRILHSFSMPLSRLKREKTTSHDDGGTKGKNGNELILEDEFEPLVGALILMVVLIVMLIWGKVCAIICAATWFYFIPGCNNITSSSTAMKLGEISGDHQVDFDSKEYKKKVVLEGLLERNQQHARV